MTSSKKNQSFFPRWIALWVLFTVPMLAWAGQQAKKSTSTAPAAAPHPASPAQHPSQPVQHSTGQPQHSTGQQQHSNTLPHASIDHPPTPSHPPAPSKGPLTYQSHPGEEKKSLPGGRTQYVAKNRTVTTDASGHVRKIETQTGMAGNKMTIAHTPGTGRQVVTGGPGSRVVSYGPKRGFVERPIAGRPGYISRTYVYGGRSYAVVYRQYGYRGFGYYGYVPAYYYGPGFYGWAVTPWYTPVPYYWGGPIVAPWFGFYAGYFVPYPVYASPDVWLTDYLLSENLRAAYENQQAENNGAPAPDPAPTSANTPPTITPEMKAMIAEEVRQQLAAEKADAAQPTAASSGQAAVDGDQVPPALSQKFFVVSSSLDVTAGSQTCSLTPGDIIERRSKDVASDGTVALEVISSKKGDCAADSAAPVQVQLADLQEMHNQLRQQIDSGLKTLADNQAKGLPAAPATKVRTVAAGTTDPASDAATKVAAQESDAGNVEAGLRQTVTN